HGVGVQPFIEYFLRMEDQARLGHTEDVNKAIDYLDEKLSAQETASAAAHHRAMYRPHHPPFQGGPGGAPGAGGLLHGIAASPAGERRDPRVVQELGEDLAPIVGPLYIARYQVAHNLR